MTEQLLQRYFSNQVTPDEAKQVLAWFDTDAGRTYLMHRLDNQFNNTSWHAPPNSAVPDADYMLNTIRQRMASYQPVRETPVRRLNWTNQSMRWAAAFVGTLIVTASAIWSYRQLNPADLIHQTAYGKISKLTLPDGSLVTLNGNSCLRYPAKWHEGKTREVWLDGEGFFQVTHQQNHERFLVHLPNRSTIEVLGTQFDVLARESRTKVVLNNGKIRFDIGEQGQKKLIMKPGDLIYADVKTRTYYRKQVNPAAQSAWQTGKLMFDGTSLAEVAQILKDTYGVAVEIADPELSRQTLSGTIPNQSMPTILNGLSSLFDLKITQHKNKILIKRT